MDNPTIDDTVIEGFHTDLPVGEILRRARIQSGQSIEYIEQVLRIRAAHLHALESGDHAALPGRVYTIGFVRTYSDYLGLNGEKIVALLKKQVLGRTVRPEYSFPVAADDASVPTQRLTIIVAAISVIFLFGLIFTLSGSDPAKKPVPPVPDDIKQEVEQSQAAAQVSGAPENTKLGDPAATASLTSPEVPPVQEESVIVRAQDNSWLEIKNASGQIVFGQILKEGQELKIPNEKGYVMTTGNAGGIDILIGEKILPKLGKAGDVRRNVTLDIEALRKLLPAGQQ